MAAGTHPKGELMGWLSFARSRPAVRRGLIAAASALLLYALFGFFALPAILKSVVPRKLSEALHRSVSVKEIRVNPFVLSATVRGLEISDRGGSAVWISAGEIYANAQLASVIRGGPVLRELRVTRPYLNVVRRPDGSYNFSDLLEKKPQKQEQPSKPLRYSFNNIQVIDGSVDFYDALKDSRNQVREIRIAVPFISNLRYYVDRYVQPSFSAMVNGDNVVLHGKTKPFEKSLDTVFDVRIVDLDLPHYLAYLPFRHPYEVPTATLDLDAAVSFAQNPGVPPAVRVKGVAVLRNVRITGKDRSPMIYLPEVRIAIAPGNLGDRQFRFGELTVRDPEVDVSIDGNKKLNLSALTPQEPNDNSVAPTGEASGEPDAGKKEAVFSVDAVRVERGKVRFRDASVPGGFRSVLDDIEIAVDGFSTEKGKAAEGTASLKTEAGERLSVKGTSVPSERTTEGSVALDNLILGKYSPYYGGAVGFDVERGTLDVRTSFRLAQGSAEPTVTLSGLEARLSGLRLRQRDEKEKFLSIPEITVRDTELNLAKREVSVGAFAMSGGALTVRRDANGHTNVLRLLPAEEGAGAAGREAMAQGGAAKSAGAPWTVSLKEGAIDRFAARYTDVGTEPPVDISLDGIRLRTKNLGTAKDRKGTFVFSTVYNRTGKIRLAGDLTIDPLAVNATIQAESVPIGVTQPYYTQRVKIVLTGGAASLDGVLSVAARSGKPLHAEYRGKAFLRDFSSVDKVRSEDFLNFKTLQFDGIRAAYHPTSVDIGEIALSDFYSRIIVNPDGTLNVQGIVGKAQDNAAQAAAGAASPADNSAAAPVPVRIGAVAMQGGAINFSDHYIRPNYSANLVDIGGRVTGLSSDPDVKADVDLRGSLGRGAPVEITGTVNPLAKSLFLDLRASVNDIDLSPMSPYSGRYAGYEIEKGKLALNLKYHVENGELKADNKVFLDQFTFGAAVDSPDATELPVRLAVSLLKDRNGEIHLDIPVSGNLDDPKFSVVGVVWKVIKNLLVKAATAPFALLSAVFGGGGEQLSYLQFDPGSAAIPQAEEGKIGTLAKILKDRPGLQLDIEGHVDVDRDREALRERAFRRKIAAAKAEDLANAGQPVPPLDNVRIDPAEYGKYLTQAYRKEPFPKPRTFLGTVKTLPVPEMEKLMMTHIRVTDDDLRRLAEARAEAVRDRLVATGSVDPGRIFLVQPKSLAPEAKENLKASRVDLRIK